MPVPRSKLPAFVQVVVYNPFFVEGDTIIVKPEIFYKAAGQCIFLLLAICWIITFIAKPISPETGKVMWEGNALRNRIGYNNLCVGFDTQPALGFAMMAWIPISYLGLKFAVQDAMRTRLNVDELSTFKVVFSLLTDLWYGTSYIGFMMTFAVHPWNNVWGHTIGFLNLAFAQWSVVFANVIEGDHVTNSAVGFCIFYGLVTLVNFGLILSNYVYYERTGHGPWEPWWIGCFFDYLWFVCLGATGLVMPNAEGIKVHRQIIDPEAIGANMEKYGESQSNVLVDAFAAPFSGLFDDDGEEDEEELDTYSATPVRN
jgi:hypothetical protein